MVGSLAVAVKGTAAEILHHLLLTERRGKSPIRMWKVKLVALTVRFGDAQPGQPSSPELPQPRGWVGLEGFFAHTRRRFRRLVSGCVFV